MRSFSRLFAGGAALAALAAISPSHAQGPDGAALRNAKNSNVLASFYPARARAAGEQGQVAFKVTLDADGYPTECRVTRSSGYPLLDSETCQIITLHAVFPRVNKSVGSASQVSTHEGVINWRLPQGAAVPLDPPSVSQAAATGAPEKTICRRTLKGDSHIGYERVCMTPTDWNRQTDESRDLWRDIRNKGNTRGG